ncbi:MAG: lysylphosphatidylglycerol synthase domain-containing protein [Rhodanobacteraceae bacterium]
MNARRLLRFGGLALSLVAIAWIVHRFASGSALELLAQTPLAPAMLAACLAAAAFAYALAMGLPALAWWRIVSGLAPHAPPALPTLGTYAASQYGKYLPGNVAHYALRHVWSRRYDIPHASLALASILEAALLVLGALAVVVGAGVRPAVVARLVDPRIAVVGVVLALVALAIALRVVRRLGWFERMHVPMPAPSMMLAALACYVAFFLACAALVAALAHALGYPPVSFALIAAASAASWLAGFVVIGAPAGLGVREAAFIALAGPALGEDRALLLIGLFRIVTFLGDTLVLAAGTAVLRLQRKPAP